MGKRNQHGQLVEDGTWTMVWMSKSNALWSRIHPELLPKGFVVVQQHQSSWATDADRGQSLFTRPHKIGGQETKQNQRSLEDHSERRNSWQHRWKCEHLCIRTTYQCCQFSDKIKIRRMIHLLCCYFFCWFSKIKLRQMGHSGLMSHLWFLLHFVWLEANGNILKIVNNLTSFPVHLSALMEWLEEHRIKFDVVSNLPVILNSVVFISVTSCSS